MKPFSYQRVSAPEAALHAIELRNSKFLGGGTNLIDLMKDGVESPTALIDINHIGLDQITTTAAGTSIGASVRNSDLANHHTIVNDYPLLSHALLSGASPQLRNMATTGGNLLQRTRCPYFMDTAFPACNKRTPGSGCAAIKGFNRTHAILGATNEGPISPHTCVATNPSDMNVALLALDAKIEVRGPKGKRLIPIADFHRLPGTTPHIDTNLHPEELITAVILPPARFAKNSWYLKVRDRQSYAFALVSIAAGLELDSAGGGAVATIKSAGLALGGVAHKPWRSLEAEKSLTNQPATPETFAKAADILLAGAKPLEHNAFKVQLAKQNIIRALTLATKGNPS